MQFLHLNAPQQPQTSPRPKVGIALEGGGALGLPHIGVVEWLGEHRIPIDYTAETSMGGLVGGIYATGLHASEIHRLVSALDWTKCCADSLYTAISRNDAKRTFAPSRTTSNLACGKAWVRLAD